LGIPVRGNYVKKSDVQKVIAGEGMWGEVNKDEIVEDLFKEFIRTTMDNEELTELKTEISDSLNFDSKKWPGDVGSFTADGDEYVLIASDDEAERIALAYVKDQIIDEPENFNKDLLQRHLFITDTDRRIISTEEADSKIESMDDEDILKETDKEEEFDAAVDADDDKLQEKILADAKEELQGKYSDEIEEQLKDPIQYFVKDSGMYTEDELLKQNFISIDYNEAAQEAVNMDGWAHFLSTYDGNYETTKGGLVYFKE
jgi:hypothetical protein